jgi:hypothetical protein
MSRRNPCEAYVDDSSRWSPWVPNASDRKAPEESHLKRAVGWEPPIPCCGIRETSPSETGRRGVREHKSYFPVLRAEHAPGRRDLRVGRALHAASLRNGFSSHQRLKFAGGSIEWGAPSPMHSAPLPWTASASSDVVGYYLSRQCFDRSLLDNQFLAERRHNVKG